MKRPFHRSAAVLAALCLGLTGAAGYAQAPKPDGRGMAASIASSPSGEQKRHGEMNGHVEAGTGRDELEEVVVTAQRVEGNGGRGRPDAGRNALSETDQTDMEGFFDDIDGLSTLGGDDQGNGFSVDGLSADLGKVTLNGQGFGEGRGSGGFNAGDLPPEMIRRVDLYRVPPASREEGGAGGLVNLQLRHPMDIPAASRSVKGRLGFEPENAKFSPSVSLFRARPSRSGKFAYMMSLSSSVRNRAFGSQDISGWVPAGGAGAGIYYPGQVRNNAVDNEQSSILAGLRAGYRPNEFLDLSATVFYSQKGKAVENHGLQYRLERQRQRTVFSAGGRLVTELASNDRKRENLRLVGSKRDDRTDSLALGLEVDWRRQGWRGAVALGHSEVKSESDPFSRTVTFAANNGFGYRAGGDGSLSMNTGEELSPVTEFGLNRIKLSDRSSEDSSGFGGFDVTWMQRGRFLRRVHAGFKLRASARARHDAKARVSLPGNLTLADFFVGRYQSTAWDPNPWPVADMDHFSALPPESAAVWEENLLNAYDMKRWTRAGYVQGDFRLRDEGERILVGNVGLRLVGTETRIEGFRSANGAGFDPLAQTNRYTELLPSVTVRVRVAQRAALTLGAARVMTHPGFNDLAPGIRFDDADKTARSGNPNLAPFRAVLYLAELAWVPQRGRRLNASVAFRDVSSYFALGEESVEFEGDLYRVTRPISGDAGHILSARMRLEQNLRRISRRLQNFSTSLSFVRNESRTDMRDPFTGARLPLPNTAKRVAKLSLDYGGSGFAGKLSYQWRGESLKASVSDSGFSAWNRPVGSLDLKLRWALNEQFQLGLDARNLLDEERVQTTDHRRQIWRITERNRSLAATFRARW